MILDRPGAFLRKLLGRATGKEPDEDADEQTGTPGQEGFGNIRQGFLEASNVEPVNELIDLITTQRSFELNSQVVQAGDQVRRDDLADARKTLEQRDRLS